jgi:hypothetical protein
VSVAFSECGACVSVSVCVSGAYMRASVECMCGRMHVCARGCESVCV